MKLILDTATGRVLGLTQWDDPIPNCTLVDAPEGFDLDNSRDYVWNEGTEEFDHDPAPPLVPTQEDPPTNLAALKVERKAALAERRWQAETGGTVVAGIPVHTDVRSQSVITGASVAAMLDENYSVQWKTSTGFVTLNREMVIGLATGVRHHIQSCFDREAALVAEIDAATTITALAEIDLNAGWPG